MHRGGGKRDAGGRAGGKDGEGREGGRLSKFKDRVREEWVEGKL